MYLPYLSSDIIFGPCIFCCWISLTKGSVSLLRPSCVSNLQIQFWSPINVFKFYGNVWLLNSYLFLKTKNKFFEMGIK